MSDQAAPLDPRGVAPGGDALAAKFAAWLTELAPSEVPDQPEPRVDLFMLVGQFVALRHEVNLQTKATRAAVDAVSVPRPADDPDRAAKPLIKALIDIADALRLGLAEVESARDRLTAPSEPRPGLLARLFAPPPTTDRVPATLAAITDGYALSVRRAERALEAAGVEPVPAVGLAFDPETMEAVGLADGEPGHVVTESRRGYRWRGQLLRAAQVTVGRE